LEPDLDFLAPERGEDGDRDPGDLVLILVAKPCPIANTSDYYHIRTYVLKRTLVIITIYGHMS